VVTHPITNDDERRHSSFVVRQVAASPTLTWHLDAARSLHDLGLLHRSCAVTWRSGLVFAVLGCAVVVPLLGVVGANHGW
jgi:hypothetical protein